MKEYTLKNVLCFDTLNVIELSESDLVDYQYHDELFNYFHNDINRIFHELPLTENKTFLDKTMFDYIKNKKHDCLIVNKSVEIDCKQYTSILHTINSIELADKFYIESNEEDTELLNIIKQSNYTYDLCEIIVSYLEPRSIIIKLNANFDEYNIPSITDQTIPLPVINIHFHSPRINITNNSKNEKVILHYRNWYLTKEYRRILGDHNFFIKQYAMVTGDGCSGKINTDIGYIRRKNLIKSITDDLIILTNNKEDGNTKSVIIHLSENGFVFT